MTKRARSKSRILAAILCFVMVFSTFASLMVLPAAASEENKLYDSSNIWETEYVQKNSDSDYGYRTSTAPKTENGVLSFERGDGIRLNWQNITGFEAFDASNTYTFTFTVKVKDFGQDVPFDASPAWNREFYFAPGGYYNQIEFRNANYTGQTGIRAGDNSADYPKGGWLNDLSVYKLDTVYNCTVEWKPSEGKIISTVKDGDTIVAQGARTNNDYKTLNKYTKSFIWRCEDGAIEVDNLVFTDGVHIYEQDFDFGAGTLCDYDSAYAYDFSNDLFAFPNAVYTTERPFTGNTAASGNNGWDKSTSPTLQDDGSLLFDKYDGMSLYWNNIEGFSLDSDKTYTIKFDAEILSKGDGTEVRTGAGWNREIYFGYGGYYNQV